MDPKNQKALVNLLLSLTDQFHRSPCPTIADTRALLTELESEYDRSYYAGIICERKAKAQLSRGIPGCGHIAHKWFHEAMECYAKAETQRAAGDDSALLRWNSCARILMAHPDICEAPEDGFHPLLE